jgi:uncharacterized SAM-binding protein YcdF (DUF218 family)
MLSALKDFVETLMVPAGLIAVLLGAAFVTSLRTQANRWPRRLLAIALLLYVAMGSGAVSRALAVGLESPFLAAHPLPASGPEAIVILSGHAAPPPLAGGGTELGGSVWRRLRRGVEVHMALAGRIPIIYSGSPAAMPDGAADESELARRAAVEWGIAPEQFQLETRSSNTAESAAAIRAWLDHQQKSKSVILVTSAWHMRRAAAAFQKQGIQVVPAACDFLSASRPVWWRTLIPSSDRLAVSTVVLREWLGILFYKLNGRL